MSHLMGGTALLFRGLEVTRRDAAPGGVCRDEVEMELVQEIEKEKRRRERWVRRLGSDWRRVVMERR